MQYGFEVPHGHNNEEKEGPWTEIFDKLKAFYGCKHGDDEL